MAGTYSIYYCGTVYPPPSHLRRRKTNSGEDLMLAGLLFLWQVITYTFVPWVLGLLDSCCCSHFCSKCRTCITASRSVLIQVQIFSYQCQHESKLSYQCQNEHKLLVDQCQTDEHDLSYQCQHGHMLSYQCQNRHKLLIHQCPTNGDNLSYHYQHGHKFLINQLQTNGHNISLYVTTRTSIQCKHGNKLLINQCETNGHNLSLYVSMKTKLLSKL